jgi:hypothetical protein
MISAPDDAVLVTRSSSTAGKHIARLLKSSNGGEIVTFGGDFRCTTQDSGSSVISYFACTGLGNPETGMTMECWRRAKNTSLTVARPTKELKASCERGISGRLLLLVSRTGRTTQNITANKSALAPGSSGADRVLSVCEEKRRAPRMSAITAACTDRNL